MLENLSIPESNLICFGDSAGETASDAIIKEVLPQATLLITEDGDLGACKEADFLIKAVNQNGVPEAISHLTQALEKAGLEDHSKKENKIICSPIKIFLIIP